LPACVSRGFEIPLIYSCLFRDFVRRPQRESERQVIYVFEDYSLDIDRRELRRGTNLVPVEPQVFDILQYLICNRQRVVGKDDLVGAVWGGRIVSESTVSSRITAARQAVGDSGETQRLIRTVPRKGVRFVADVRQVGEQERKLVERPATAAVTSRPALTLPDKPSIAVLPFENMSGDPNQDYFADGIVEEIITALSRFRQLFVIARNSTFTYKGRAVDVKQVGSDLGVRYVLEGSVRKAASRVRITGQLVDTVTGAHLWADRFDGKLDDIFDLQDQVTASVVGSIAPRLEKAEIERARHKQTESLDAYEHYLHGLAKFYQLTGPHDCAQALHLFKRAIDLDPHFSSAYGHAAYCYAWGKSNGWISDSPDDVAECARLARRALELGKDDAFALATSGWAMAYVVRDLDAAAAFIDAALMLNPNLSEAWFCGGWVKIWLSEPDAAIERFARAIRLSPLGARITGMRRIGIAHGHFFRRRYDEAVSWSAIALRDAPDFQPGLRIEGASNAAAGHLEAARKAVARLRRLNPTLRVSNLRDVLGPYRYPEDLARYEDGLRKAGLPE
jgi:TolB-like protein/tetratricopeptide (TPR) repeat protein